jgi:hypothetical protein
MAISDNISKKAKAIHDEFQEFQAGRIPDTPIGTKVQELSCLAILGGNKSQAWIDYMTLFKETAQELDRLIPRDGSTTDPREKARAYLVSNGMCGMGTTDTLANTVDKTLDLP